MDVNNYVENFIKEFDIKAIDVYTLKTVICKLGFEILEYNPLLNNDQVNTIITGLDLKEKLKNKSCFTYKSKLASYIFIRNNLTEYELIYLLLHEIGHIYMHHVDKDITDRPEYYEHEANKFADEVKFYIKQINQDNIKNDMKNRKKRKALYAVPAFLLSAAAITAIVLFVKQSKSDEYKYYQEIPETTTAITEIATEPITEAITEKPTEVTEITTEPATEPITEEITEAAANNDSDDETLYYVSASGTKYHLKTCYHINPERCTALPLDRILEMGYTPCRTCEPDKRS